MYLNTFCIHLPLSHVTARQMGTQLSSPCFYSDSSEGKWLQCPNMIFQEKTHTGPKVSGCATVCQQPTMIQIESLHPEKHLLISIFSFQVHRILHSAICSFSVIYHKVAKYTRCNFMSATC